MLLPPLQHASPLPTPAASDVSAVIARSGILPPCPSGVRTTRSVSPLTAAQNGVVLAHYLFPRGIATVLERQKGGKRTSSPSDASRTPRASSHVEECRRDLERLLSDASTSAARHEQRQHQLLGHTTGNDAQKRTDAAEPLSEFERHKRHAQSLTRPGDAVPTFLDEHAMHALSRDGSYVGRKLFALRSDPRAWYAFTETINDALERKRRGEGATDVVRANVARAGAHRPDVRAAHRAAAQRVAEGRRAAAFARAVANAAADPPTAADRRAERREGQRRAWAVAIAAAAFARRLAGGYVEAKNAAEGSRREAAARVVQRAMQRFARRRRMRPVRAVVVRTKFLLRVLVRVRCMLRVRRLAAVRNFLEALRKTPLTVPRLKRLRVKVVWLQRFWRRRAISVGLHHAQRFQRFNDALLRFSADWVAKMNRARFDGDEEGLTALREMSMDIKAEVVRRWHRRRQIAFVAQGVDWERRLRLMAPRMSQRRKSTLSALIGPKPTWDPMLSEEDISGMLEDALSMSLKKLARTPNDHAHPHIQPI